MLTVNNKNTFLYSPENIEKIGLPAFFAVNDAARSQKEGSGLV
jgi:hypothetical protein